MLENLKLLREFYKKETKGWLIFHKFMTLCYYLSFGIFSRILSRNVTKYIFRYFKIGSLPLKIQLKDDICIYHPLDAYTIFFEVVLDDIYELKKLKRGSIVVDVGAHVGLVSVLSSKGFNAKKVISFEPCSNNFKLLKKNKEVNECKNIIIHNLAVSDRKGKVKLYLGGSETHSIIKKLPGNGFENIELITLNEALEKEPIIDLLKI
ncbi:MAG: FkbM family methyltransferase [Candidatus Altiarchaeota archaeon]